MEEERGAHSIWSEHHRVVRRIDRRSLPRRVVGAAASFFVCSARDSMIEVVRASGSARSTSAMQIRNGGGADSEQRAAAFGILAPLAVRRARLAFAACSTRGPLLPLHNCRWRIVMSNRRSSRRLKYFHGCCGCGECGGAAASSAEQRRAQGESSAELNPPPSERRCRDARSKSLTE